MNEVKNYLKPNVCAECGGTCCLKVAGCCYPSDFKDRESIKQAILGGKYCFDCWEGDPRKGKNILSRAYFIRPSGKGKEGDRFDFTWGGISCTFLTDSGCSLSPDDRPTGCRMLEPMPNGEGCVCHDEGKRSASIAWLEYGIDDLIRELKEVE